MNIIQPVEKHWEMALRSSELRYRRLFETAQDGILILDAETGMVVDVNPFLVKLLGYSHEIFLGKKIWELGFFKDIVANQDNFTELQAKEYVRYEDLPLETSEGRRIEVEFVSNVYLVSGHKVIQCNIRDITQRKQAENKLAQINRYRIMGLEILQFLNQSVDVVDLMKCILHSLKIQTGFDAIGIRLQDGEDFPYYVQDGFSPDFLRTENTILARSKVGGVCRDNNGSIRLECTCGLVISGKTDPANPAFTTGGSFWTNDALPMLGIPPEQDPRLHPRNQCIHQGFASVALVPIREQDRIVGLIQFNDRRKNCFTVEGVELLEGIAGHMGAALVRKQVEQSLLVSNRQLMTRTEELRQMQQQIVQQASLRALGQMASGLAHDFNNSLSPIIGFSELLLKHPEKLADREYVTRFLQFINTAGHDASDVVRRLREFGRTRAEGEISEAIDLADLIQNTLELTQPRWKDQAQADGRTIQIATDLQKVPPIACEESAIREVLTNLIFNAVDALSTGGTITIGIARAGEFVRMWVSDNGCGMPEEVRQHCFEPFFTTKGDKGTGLGLAMVYGIVQRHGGTTELTSKLGQGTTITIRLPYQPPKPATIVIATAVALERRLRVLVVDDEPMLRDIAEAWLIADGHTVATAENGAGALTQLKSDQFDLVITDKAMPAMSGEQLAVAIQAIAPGLPVILMSGFGDLMKSTGEMPPYIGAILSKPITEASLRTVLTKVFPPQLAEMSSQA